MEKTITSKKSIIIAIITLLVLIAGFFAAYHFFRQQGEAGAKSIHVDVIVDEVIVRSVDIHTDAAYLRQALEEHELILGEESLYGLMVKTVNGRTADDAKEEWWCFSKGGVFLTTGVDDTPIEDGDAFEITLKVGYEW